MATAEAAYYYSKREARRFAQLYKEKVVAQNTYETKLQEADVNGKLYATAKENLALVMSGPRPDAIESQRAVVRQKEAIAQDARKELELTVIRSSASGRVVTARPKDKLGQTAIEGDLILSVEDSRALRAEVQVPEQTTGKIKPGARVKVKAWTFPNRTFDGKVVSVAPVVVNKQKEGTVDYTATEREDSMSRATTSDPGRVVRVLVSIPNPDGLLKSEMTGYAKVRVGYEPFGKVMTHGLIRFFLVEVWSWIP
jgi:multidrug resistance efflux pump